MLRSSTSKKSKEAETVKISAIPENPVKFKAWKSDVRAQIAATSGQADRGLVWALEVEKESATFDSLQDSGKFPTLDVKLSAALTKLAHGDLGREIALQQERAAKDGRLLRGRQALFMIYQHFKTAEEAGALYDLVDLTKVLSTTHGGKQIDLTTFLQNWEAVLAGMKVEPDITIKETLFKEQIKVYKQIEHDIATYHRAKPGDPERSYDFLMTSAKSYLQRQREDKNRKAVQDKLSAKEQLALPAPPSDRGDKDRRKSGKGGSRSRGRSQSPAEARERVEKITLTPEAAVRVRVKEKAEDAARVREKVKELVFAFTS